MWAKAFIFLFLIPAFIWAASSDFRLELARKLAKEGKVEMAIREYKNYLSENPHAPNIYEELAQLRIRQGKYKFAILNYSLALKQNPNLETAQEGLALGYELNGEREKALIEWRKLASITSSSIAKNRAESHIEKLLGKLKEPNKNQPSLEKEKLLESDITESPDLTPDKKQEKELSATKPKGLETSKEKAEQVEVKKSDVNDSSLWSSKEVGKPEEQNKVKAEKPKATVQEKPQEKLVEKKSEEKNIGDMENIVSLYNSGKKDEALLAVRQMIKKQPGHPGAYYYGGVIRYDKGDFNKAIYNFKQSYDYPELGFNAHFYLGRIYQKLNQNQNAIRAFKKYVELTESASGKKQAEAYIAQLEKSSSKNDNNIAERRETRTKSIVPASEKTNPAVARFENGLMFFIPDQSQSDSKHSEAVALLESKKWEAAINLLKELSGSFGGSFKSDIAELNIGSIYERMGLYDKAKNKLELYLSSKHSKTFKNQAEFLLAKSELGLQNWNNAEQKLKYVKVDAKWGPSDLEKEKLWAKIYLGKGQNDKAVSHLNKLAGKVKKPEDKVNVWLQVSNIHKSNKHPIAMEKTLLNAKEQCNKKMLEGCDVVYLELADNYFKGKKWKQAQNSYNQFLKSFPSHKEAAWAEYQQGNIYKRSGQYKKALDSYRDMIEKYPESYWANQAKWEREDAIWKNEYSDVLD